MNKLIGLCMIVVLLAPAPGSAQVSPTEGERIRVRIASGKTLIGVMEHVEGEALAVSNGSRHHLVSLDEIVGLDRSLGRERRFVRTFVTAVAITSVATGVGSMVVWEPCVPQGWFDCLLSPDSRGEAFVWGMALGGIMLGVPIGTIAGLAITYDRWDSAAPPTPGAAQPTFALRGPTDRRAGLKVSIPVGGR